VLIFDRFLIRSLSGRSLGQDGVFVSLG